MKDSALSFLYEDTVCAFDDVKKKKKDTSKANKKEKQKKDKNYEDVDEDNSDLNLADDDM